MHFKDGSVHEETTVFTQRRTFQLRTCHLVRKGRSFKQLPPDLANGLSPALLSDIDPKKPKTTLPMVAATPKPRLVKLEITPQGEDSFSNAGSPRKALHYAIRMAGGEVPGFSNWKANSTRTPHLANRADESRLAAALACQLYRRAAPPLRSTPEPNENDSHDCDHGNREKHPRNAPDLIACQYTE